MSGIPYETLYQKAEECYKMFSEGLRQIVIDKHIGIDVACADIDPLSPRSRNELCLIADIIILYYLVNGEQPHQFLLTDGAEDQTMKEMFDEIVHHAFVLSWEDELDQMVSPKKIEAQDKTKAVAQAKFRNAFDGFPFDRLHGFLSADSREYLNYFSGFSGW